MQVYATMGFAAAWDKAPGDYVAMGGVARRVLAVVRTGRNAPLYRLEGVPADHWMAEDGLVSWQVVGDAR